MRHVLTIPLAALAVVTLFFWAASYFWVFNLQVPGFSAGEVVDIEPTAGRVWIMVSHYSPPPPDRGIRFSTVPVSEVRAKIDDMRSIGIMTDRLAAC